jgi:hypothetical protein
MMNETECEVIPLVVSTSSEAELHWDVCDSYNLAAYVGVPPCHDAVMVIWLPEVTFEVEDDTETEESAGFTFTFVIDGPVTATGTGAESVTVKQ